MSSANLAEAAASHTSRAGSDLLHPKPIRPEHARVLLYASACLLVSLLGCGSTAPRPIVGPIQTTTATGTTLPSVTALTAGSSVYLLVAVTNDATLGVDWTVTCSSAVPAGSLPAGTIDASCGTFSPAHTASAPVPKFVPTGIGYVTQYTAPAVRPKAGTITLFANATALPTRVSTITLPVN